MKKFIEKFWDEIFPVIYAVLFFVLILLRLFKIITWSWWWVLSPLWGLFALIIIIFIGAITLIVSYYVFGVIKIYWKHWRGKV